MINLSSKLYRPPYTKRGPDGEHMKNKIFISLLIILGFCITDASARDYWGLCNINNRVPDSVYVGFDADYYAFAVSC